MGIFFNGRFFVRPTVATFIDDSALQPVGLVGANVIGMIGPAKDGIPNQAYLLTSLRDATEIFSEGPLVEGVAAAFASGAQFIWATRIGGTYTAATHTFTNQPVRASYATGGSPDIPFKLWSKIYGEHANGISVTIDVNTTKGLDIDVVAFGNTYSAVGVYSDALKVVNNNAVSVTFTIAKNVSVYGLTISDGTNTTAEINLANYSNMIDLVVAINQAMVTATPAAITDVVVTSLIDTAKPIELDKKITAISTATTGYISKNVKAAFDWLNSGQQPYVNAEDTGDIFTTVEDKDVSLLEAGSDFVLTGGSFGSVDATAYQGVLAEIYEDLDIDLVVPIVDDYLTYSLTSSTTPDSIFQYVLDHCKYMSTLGSDERKGLVGYQFTADGDADTLVTSLKAKALAFNSPYIIVCTPKLKRFTLLGALKEFNGTYTAAWIAGMIAGFNIGEPITNKTVSGIQGLSTFFKNRQIIQLLDAGVLSVERVPSGVFKVVQGITTWTTDENFNKKEISVGLASNFIAKNCRETLKQFVGRKNSPFILQTIKGALIQILKDLESQEIIVGTTDVPAFRNIIISADGDIVNVSFECSPVLPINYVLITLHMAIFKTAI